jgi:hypothetical protein
VPVELLDLPRFLSYLRAASVALNDIAGDRFAVDPRVVRSHALISLKPLITGQTLYAVASSEFIVAKRSVVGATVVLCESLVRLI